MSREHAAKRRRLSPPEDGSASPPPKSTKASFLANAAKWDLEQDYETRPRKMKKQKEAARLPVKTAEGWEQPAPGPLVQAKEEEEEESDAESAAGEQDEDQQQRVDEAAPEEPRKSNKQEILEAKEELARIATLINEDPEEHIAALKTLQALQASPNTTVRKLTLAASVAIYKDLIPGYRIRPLNEDAMTDKVSKEVRKLRNFEQKLVSGYQTFVESLGKLAKSSGSANQSAAGIATVAISCACNLLLAVPHFNFRGELLKILIGKLSTRRVDGDFVKCRETLEKLFESDEDGNVSLDAVTMLTKMMKGKNYNFDESVLNTFLHLRLLSEFGGKASYNSVDKPQDEYMGKKIKQKREFRTKKTRKLMKEQKAIEKEMKEADATVSHEERDRMQAETLKMVFVAYFRILKARSPKLMGAVLEGLASYAHMINQDFFGDILEALRDIIATAEISAAAEDSDQSDAEDDDDETPQRNLTRESLLCVITAFALLQGQDGQAAEKSLKLDLSFFITHLYRTLHAVSLNPDIELSANSLHLPDPNAPESQTTVSTATNKINVKTTVVLLIRSLTSVLLPATAIRSVPPVRIAAFCKQLLTISLQLPEKSCIAMVGLLTKVTKVHGRKIESLWNTEERRGDGVFDAMKPEIESSNPFAATVWEGELLRRHFCPTVRDAILGVEKNILEAR